MFRRDPALHESAFQARERKSYPDRELYTIGGVGRLDENMANGYMPRRVIQPTFEKRNCLPASLMPSQSFRPAVTRQGDQI